MLELKTRFSRDEVVTGTRGAHFDLLTQLVPDDELSGQFHNVWTSHDYAICTTIPHRLTHLCKPHYVSGRILFAFNILLRLCIMSTK